MNEIILNGIIEQFKRFEKAKVLNPKYRKELENLIGENKELKIKNEELKNENRLLISRNYRLTNYCEELQDIIMVQEKKIKMKEGEENV